MCDICFGILPHPFPIFKPVPRDFYHIGFVGLDLSQRIVAEVLDGLGGDRTDKEPASRSGMTIGL